MRKLDHSRILAARLFASGLLFVNIGTALAATHYVDVNSTNATPPYTDWSTAATNIQDAVDAAVAGDEVVVTNGIYDSGFRSNDAGLSRVVVDKPLTVRSVNGPQFTTIAAAPYVELPVRCVYLTNVASLSGFTLTNGSAGMGGGVYGGTLINCTLTGNYAWAYNRLGSVALAYGGGAYVCTLINCTLTSNSVSSSSSGAGTRACGGAAYGSELFNCTVTGNSADDVQNNGRGGGTFNCDLYNCIVYFNTAPFGANYYGDTPDSYEVDSSCTTPYATNGFGNIASPPRFVDLASGNLRLQSNSPCINAGNNAFAPTGPDLDGNPRIVGGTVDIGAYEFQSPVSHISYAWLYQFGLPINSSTDTADPDGDAVDNYHEWLAGTDPTNPLSSPAQLTINPSGVPPSEIILTWSTNAVGFTLQSTTSLFSPAAWVTNSGPVVVNGQNTVTKPITGAQQFYRLIH